MKNTHFEDVPVPSLLDLFRLQRLGVNAMTPMPDADVDDLVSSFTALPYRTPTAREAWVKQVKAALERGAYESEQNLNAAIDRMIDEEMGPPNRIASP